MSNPIPDLASLPVPPANREGWPWTASTPPLPPTRRDGSPWPRLTIVTPSYQQGEFLEETIRSVLLQGYPELEYLVMDGGSTDGSAEVIRRYERWLAGWVSEKDGGQTQAVNKGFRRGSGDILGWLNSDDILLPGALQKIAEAFRDSQVMVVTGFRKFYDAQSRFWYNYFDWLPTDESIRLECIIAQETTYWRREVWNKLGELDESYRYAMDYEYWHRMLDAGYHFTLVPAYLGGFRMHDRSKWATMADVRRQELGRIYAHYRVADSESELAEKIRSVHGQDVARKRRLLACLSGFSITHNPRVFIWAYHLLHVPVLPALLACLVSGYSRAKTAWFAATRLFRLTGAD